MKSTPRRLIYSHYEGPAALQFLQLGNGFEMLDDSLNCVTALLTSFRNNRGYVRGGSRTTLSLHRVEMVKIGHLE